MERGNHYGSSSLHLAGRNIRANHSCQRAFLRSCSPRQVLLRVAAVPSRVPRYLKGTHGGTTFRLPDDKGFVELVNEPVVIDPRNPQPTSIVAYFYQADGKSAMSPSPTDVSFQIDPDARSRQRDKAAAGSSTLPLSAEPKADDPAGASRFASKTGPYYLAAVRGTLKAKINGQDISTAFMGSR